MIRIVKMEFEPSKIDDFLKLFEERKERIASFPGCTHLELLRDKEQNNIFFTYSFWNSPADLEQYRNSEFFADTWKHTKILFKNKAAAWSVDSIYNSDLK